MMRVLPSRRPHALKPLSVALLAAALWVAVPASAHAQFPSFIPTASTVTPSGVTVDKAGNVYVSVRQDGRGLIWKYTPDGSPTFFADVGQADIYGLAVTANGLVYAAMAVGPDHGVYRVDREGHAVLVPGSDQMLFPNGFASDDRGTVYVTESHSASGGGIWRIPPGGAAEPWVRHALLNGIGLVGGPVGANGIVYFHGDLFVSNTDKKLVVRIAVGVDGTPGEPEVWKQVEEVPESPLAGSPFPIMPDGLALDVFGNVYVAVLTRNAIVRLDAADGAQSTVAVLRAATPSAPLDTPASLAFGTGAGEQQNLFVTNLGWMVRFVPAATWPGPALVRIPVGVPGRPLR